MFKRKKTIISIGFISFFSGVIITALLLFYSVLPIYVLDSVWHLGFKKRDSGFYILLVGVDNSAYMKRSDTIMMVYLDPIHKKANVLSIPRDTLIHLPSRGLVKMNYTYATGGMPLLKKALSQLLGIPIHYSASVDLNQLKRIFEKMGPMAIDVEKRMTYQDHAGELNIDFKKGVQVLSAQQLTEFVRFRNDREGDIGRIRRQQYVLESGLNHLKTNMSMLTLIKHLPEFKRLVKTDLSLKDIVSLVKLVYQLDMKDVKRLVLPGEISMYRGVSYWRPNLLGLDHVLSEHFFHHSLSLIDEPDPIDKKEGLVLSTPSSEIVKERVKKDDVDQKALNKSKVRIEVLNGNGKQKAAYKVAELLEKEGFNVIRVDDAGHFSYEKTMLVNWRGDVDYALLVGAILGIDASEFVLYQRDEKPLEMSIVVGKDRF